MKKLLVFIFITVISLLLIIGIINELAVPDFKNIKEINLCLTELDNATFNDSQIITVKDENEIKEIVEIMQFKKWRIIYSKDPSHDFAYNPAGYVDIIFKNDKIKRFEFAENKKAFFYNVGGKFNLYFKYENNAFETLKGNL